MRNFCSRLRRNSAAWADSAGVSSLPRSSIITKLSSITFAVDAVAFLEQDGSELGSSVELLAPGSLLGLSVDAFGWSMTVDGDEAVPFADAIGPGTAADVSGCSDVLAVAAVGSAGTVGGKRAEMTVYWLVRAMAASISN